MGRLADRAVLEQRVDVLGRLGAVGEALILDLTS
jgi:hypothetical protein